MRLRADPTTSRALRFALEDDPSDLPSSAAIADLAEVLQLRIRESNPARLSDRTDTSNALRAAMLVESSPDPDVIRAVWAGIRSAVDIEANKTKYRSSSEHSVKTEPVRSVVRLPSRRGRQAILAAVGVAAFTALAAAGFELLGYLNFSSRGTPSVSPSKRDTLKQRPGSRLTVPPTDRFGSEILPQQTTLTSKPSTALAEPKEIAQERKATTTRVRVTASPARSLDNSSDNSLSVVTEIHLLRKAWAELRAGRPESALVVAQEHATRFPAGALVQEREIVEIQALKQLGNGPEARRKAASFEQKFPDSPHRPLEDAGVSDP
jgi:hypothetical protein